MIFLVQSIFRKIDERHVFDCEEKNLENIFASQFIFPDKKEKKKHTHFNCYFKSNYRSSLSLPDH